MYTNALSSSIACQHFLNQTRYQYRFSVVKSQRSNAGKIIDLRAVGSFRNPFSMRALNARDLMESKEQQEPLISTDSALISAFGGLHTRSRKRYWDLVLSSQINPTGIWIVDFSLCLRLSPVVEIFIIAVALTIHK